MISEKEISSALDKMIISASGWRGIFGADEESNAEQISAAHFIIAAAAAFVFVEYLSNNGRIVQKKTLLVGTDTRPTGKKIAEAMITVLLACGCNVQYAGIVAAPEIMAWARSKRSSETEGFIYISASHNPIGYNGIKFGLTDGGVLAAEEAVQLIKNFRLFFEKDGCIKKIEGLISAADDETLKKIFANAPDAKKEAYNAYYDFCIEAALGKTGASLLREEIIKKPAGIVCDFNGSARAASVDREFFPALGLKFKCINSEPGQIAHCIVPEGQSLEPCRVLLENARARDASFVLGYMPDCDGDRGNLVICDENGKARTLEAQEVFALACVSEFAFQVWTEEFIYDENGVLQAKAAIAVNDPTSMRIDQIAQAFGIEVFRAEVGEANVVGLARILREQGCTVRILGEGSAGGNITHPSAVRDPISTVLAIVKLLCLRSNAKRPGLYEIWCKRSGQTDKYREVFSLSDIIASLPQRITTPVYSDDAVLRIKTNDHAELKDRYQKVFLRRWEEQKDDLKLQYGICKWEAAAYNGFEERRNISRFAEAGKGGLKIRFLSEEGRELAFIWMRGSATEPVFRIMADIEGTDKEAHMLLLDWQRSMIIEADNNQ